MSRKIKMIYAITHNGVIGKDGGLPWRIPGDLKRFRELTLGHVVLMGRKTWESLPVRPLTGRVNVVLSRDPAFHPEGALVFKDVQDVLTQFADQDIWVIGGGQIYEQLLDVADEHYVTYIDQDIDGDTYGPELRGRVVQLEPREFVDQQTGLTIPFCYITTQVKRSQ